MISYSSKKRSGVTLLVVLVLIVMISLGVYSFAQLMTAQEQGTVMAGRRLQAQAAVAAGVEYVKDYLVLTPEQRLEEVGGHWDNETHFKDIAVGGEQQGNTRFSIISIVEDEYGEPTDVRYGLTDQGSRLNVNFLATEAYGKFSPQEGSLDADPREEDEGLEDEEDEIQPARDALMLLPGMTEIIADSILDWIDEDDIPREFGSESGLNYEPRNGPIRSLDELLLIEGVTNELLYGADLNHNGLLDANEQTGDAAIADGNGSMARGWSAYLTTRSQDLVEQDEENVVDLNQDDLEVLFAELTAKFDEDFAAYVVVYRQSGAYQAEVPEDAPDDYEAPVPEPISGRQIDFSKGGETKINSVLDLLGSLSEGSFTVPGKDEPEKVVVQSPYADGSQLATVLPMMMSLLKAEEELGGSSGVNANHCASPVMGGLPGLESDVVQNILQMQDREGASGDPNYLYPTWPLGMGAISIEEMKALMPFMAGPGTVFRAQIVGYSDIPGVFARAEVVIDASGEEPRVLSWRDLSHLGLGFPLETLTQ